MDAINWEAYSHEELHRMLWQDADVADVSTLADEWTRHREALDTHAAVLKEQRAALLDGWHGAAAEEAGARLARLAERIEKISEFSAAGEKAAQDAADALAQARVAMPPPPAGTTTPAFAGSPTGAAPSGPGTPFAPPAGAVPFGAPTGPGTPFAPPAGPGAPFGTPAGATPIGAPTGTGTPFTLPAGAAPFSLPSAPAPFANTPFTLPSAPAPMTLPSAPTMPAGATSGFYFYFGAASADQQKADAVRAMQTYESNLNGSGRLIDNARGTIPQTAPAPATVAAAPPPIRTPSSGGVPWRQLVGGGGGSGRGAVPAARGPVIGATPQVSQLTPGMRAGVMTGHTIGPLTSGSPLSEGRTAAQGAGMAPAGAGARKDDDQEHENQMPTLDHGLFVVDDRVSPAVIGEEQ
ncbi:hypothetical protein [Lentzea sp. NPDC051838]|uniref:hypothetical protein n=1 Tax=Lentzea sp. NPDC051838 TaxID=3154849 RepID=UPI00344A11A1